MRKVLLASGLGILMSGSAWAQQSAEITQFPTAAVPPYGDAYPTRQTEFDNGIVGIADITYSTITGFRPLSLDFYHDPEASDLRPLVIYIHGGGWERGHKRASGVFTDFPGVLANLASRGFVTASVEYRLSGEAPFPAAIQDIKAAIRYLRENASDYGIDPDRIGLWGNSAGGQLAALAAVTCDDDTSASISSGDTETSDCVQAAAIWYGVTDFGMLDAEKEPTLNSDPGARYLGCTPGHCPSYVVNAASAARHVDAKDPAFLLGHGTVDKVVPISQSYEMEALLKDAGVPVETHYVEGVGHSWTGTEESVTRTSTLEAVDRTFDFFIQRLEPTSTDK